MRKREFHCARKRAPLMLTAYYHLLEVFLTVRIEVAIFCSVVIKLKYKIQRNSALAIRNVSFDARIGDYRSLTESTSNP